MSDDLLVPKSEDIEDDLAEQALGLVKAQLSDLVDGLASAEYEYIVRWSVRLAGYAHGAALHGAHAADRAAVASMWGMVEHAILRERAKLDRAQLHALEERLSAFAASALEVVAKAAVAAIA